MPAHHARTRPLVVANGVSAEIRRAIGELTANLKAASFGCYGQVTLQ